MAGRGKKEEEGGVGGGAGWEKGRKVKKGINKQAK